MRNLQISEEELPLSSSLSEKARALLVQQKATWPLAIDGYRQLAKSKSRVIEFGTGFIELQFNPRRMQSCTAKIDKKSIEKDDCFLCARNLPCEQKGISFLDKYWILCNPYPIFRQHLTIPLKDHLPQRIRERFGDMLTLCQRLDDFVVFYNGPECGASAPDHFHFQAGEKGFMPIDTALKKIIKPQLSGSVCIFKPQIYSRKALMLESANQDFLRKAFEQAYLFLEKFHPEPEPMLNILAYWLKEKWRVVIFPRKRHRPWQYFAQGDDRVLLSPGCVDFGGKIILPRRKDFDRLSSKIITDIFSQTRIGEEQFDALMTAFL